MNLLLTVCARGGSKGLKNKHLLPLGGKPLIAWTFEQAKRWGKASRIVCSTDSDDIAAAARAAGAEVPFVRPVELASDTAGKVPVVRHALRKCEEEGTRYDAVVDLDATAPLRTSEDLDRCLERFIAVRPQVLFSVVAARKNPYFNMIERRKDGSLGIVMSLASPTLRRQDAPEVFELNASIYIYDAAALREGAFPGVLQSRFDICEMAEDAAFDVDTETGLHIVQALMRRRGWIPG